MKKFFIVLMLSLVLFSCDNTKTQNEFVNVDCNIPIIECVLGNDTVNMIVDTGAEYSLINSEYFQKNQDNFHVMNEIGTQFFGIGGVLETKVAKVINAETSLGIMTLVEQDLSAVVQSLPEYNVVGLIGSDFLKSRNYIVDYKIRRIYPYELRDSIYKSYGN